MAGTRRYLVLIALCLLCAIYGLLFAMGLHPIDLILETLQQFVSNNGQRLPEKIFGLSLAIVSVVAAIYLFNRMTRKIYDSAKLK